eukprot:TRINITY_DN67436_c5_g1_i2.p1 TRINITY_DN67436_c5_g1~~TRINITY_DN67436_c5_g1_i2.p1  ORF type:complete len:181 (+),score=13.43 TRINITY_DN67436_c5_g1_i2:51-593(+)
MLSKHLDRPMYRMPEIAARLTEIVQTQTQGTQRKIFKMIDQRGITYTVGRAELYDDTAIGEQHFRIALSKKKPVLIVQMLTALPAFYWKRGQKGIPFKRGQPVELCDGDIFSCLHSCYLMKIDIAPRDRIVATISQSMMGPAIDQNAELGRSEEGTKPLLACDGESTDQDEPGSPAAEMA